MIGDANVQTGTMDVWGGDPASVCTGNFDYGCLRTGGAGGNIVNPVMSARLRTAETFAFKYGRVEVVAALPRGDWLWPAIWLLPVRQDYGTCAFTRKQARSRRSGVEAVCTPHHYGVSGNGLGAGDARIAVAHTLLTPAHHILCCGAKLQATGLSPGRSISWSPAATRAAIPLEVCEHAVDSRTGCSPALLQPAERHCFGNRTNSTL
jgi:hypothetical protein